MTPNPLVARIVVARGFTRSRPSEPDATLQRRMAEDGYLFVPGLVPVQRLLRVRRLVLERCAEHGWLDLGAAIDDGRAAPGLIVSEPEPRYHRLYQPLIRTALFNALAQSPELMAFAARMLGDDVYAHQRSIARLIFRGAATTQPHQDHFYIGGAEDTWTAWIPLGDCPMALGSLAVLAGSHRLGPQPHVAAVGAGGHGVEADGCGLRWLASDFACGDALLFHSRTIHAGLDNRTDRLRLSVDLRYQRAGDPIDPASLVPHYHGTALAREADDAA